MVIARIVPAAVGQAGNMLKSLKVGIGFLSVGEKIEVLVIGRCLQGIIQVRGAVPGPVTFTYFHVIHLYGQERVERQVPGIVMHGWLHAKRLGVGMAVFKTV